jgi:DNA-binding MarR family transcriptional regulator
MIYFLVCKGLLEAKHRKGMGVAVWEFLWCLDRMTKIDAAGMGLVLGGKPINLSDFADQFGTSEVTVSRNLQRLSRYGYLAIIHAPYGIIIKVPKAKKRFSRNADSQEFHRFNKSDGASLVRHGKPHYENDKPGYKSDIPNKRSKDEKKDESSIVSMDELIEKKKFEIAQFLKTL